MHAPSFKTATDAMRCFGSLKPRMLAVLDALFPDIRIKAVAARNDPVDKAKIVSSKFCDISCLCKAWVIDPMS